MMMWALGGAGGSLLIEHREGKEVRGGSTAPSTPSSVKWVTLWPTSQHYLRDHVKWELKKQSMKGKGRCWWMRRARWSQCSMFHICLEGLHPTEHPATCCFSARSASSTAWMHPWWECRLASCSPNHELSHEQDVPFSNPSFKIDF